MQSTVLRPVLPRPVNGSVNGSVVAEPCLEDTRVSDLPSHMDGSSDATQPQTTQSTFKTVDD